MAEFQVLGNVSPFLLVSLQQGEKIYAESDAMVSMETTLDLKGQMRGGFLSALSRRLTAGESFFQQTIEASRGPGDALFGHIAPGGVEILDVGARQFNLNDGAFLAASDTVNLTVRSQGVGQALFGGTGGLFIMETSGTGQLAITGYGEIFGLQVNKGHDVIVDNGHVVAWERTLSYEVTTATQQGGGFLGRLTSAVTSGEGIVTRFSGDGTVYVASRNLKGFSGWLGRLIKPS